MIDDTTPPDPQEIPYGYCHCGCGQKTTIAPISGRGYKRGEPRQFLKSHHSRNVLSLAQILENNLAKRGPDECWLWTGATDSKGYGRIYRMRDHVRMNLGAHRVAYELHYGQISSDDLICHKCDNPPCCNPLHLFVGTQSDNIQDMIQKRRRYQPNVVGVANGRAKLKEEEVRHVRELHAAGLTYREISDRTGVHEATVSNVVRRKTWTHMP